MGIEKPVAELNGLPTQGLLSNPFFVQVAKGGDGYLCPSVLSRIGSKLDLRRQVLEGLVLARGCLWCRRRLW